MRIVQLVVVPGDVGIYALGDDGSVFHFEAASGSWTALPAPPFPAPQAGPMPTSAAQNIGAQASESAPQLQQQEIKSTL